MRFAGFNNMTNKLTLQVKSITELTDDEILLRMDALDALVLRTPFDAWPAEKLRFINRQWIRLSVLIWLRSRGQ